MCLEILLDIHDYKGDKNEKVYTIPVIFGKDIALLLSLIFLESGIIVSTIETLHYPIFIPISFYVYSLPIFSNIVNCNSEKYSEESILKVTNKTSRFLMFSLLTFFYCALNI